MRSQRPSSAMFSVPVAVDEARSASCSGGGEEGGGARDGGGGNGKFRASFNWLDRLRAAKGFPVGPDLRVEDFLGSGGSASPPESQVESSVNMGSSSSSPPGNAALNNGGISRVVSATMIYVPEVNAATGNNLSPGVSSDKDDAGELNSAHSSRCRSSDPSTVSSAERPAKTALERSFGELGSLVARVHDDEYLKHIQAAVQEDTRETSPPSPDIPNNLFADIFAMGDCYKADAKPQGRVGDLKKHKRKQVKPRLCPTSSFSVLPGASTASSHMLGKEGNSNLVEEGNRDLSSATFVRALDPPNIVQENAEKSVTDKHSVEDDSDESNAVSNTKRQDCEKMIEVLIIDTSLADWKAAKILLRKGKHWKIRDRRGDIPENADRTKLVSIRRSSELSVVKSGGLVDCNSDSVEEILCSKKKGLRKMQRSNKNNTRTNHQFVPKALDKKVEEQETVIQSEFRKERLSSEFHDVGTVIDVAKDAARLQPMGTTDLDHPANQPKETLTYSVYEVFFQAGKAGLTAREAVSRILECGLPGLHEGGVVPRVEVLKIISNSPYFMLLEESKYILCSALIGDNDQSIAVGSIDSNKHQRVNIEGKRHENVSRAIQQSVCQYWAAWAAVRRARTGKSRRKPSLGVCSLSSALSQEMSELPRKKRLKTLKQEISGLGNPCNRSDGKGWHCPLRAKVGYLLCDHHLDRLRLK